MEIRTYRNKAFLSYRHVEKDKKAAAMLQKELEHFRIPAGIRKKRQIGESGMRIFRDTTDLGARADLTEELRRELEDSEYMIVLCSEETADSAWVGREIRFFLQSHGADRILPVLVDGEPEEVLAAVFSGIEAMSRHPLACDLRDSGRNLLPLPFQSRFRKEELSRLAAALLDCPYDELVNRRQRYETRRMAVILTGALALLSLIAAYYAYSSAQIRRSYREQQTAQSESLAVQSETALSQRYRLDAIRSALDALPDREGDRPVAGQAVLALQRAAAAYVPEGSRELAQTAEYQTPGRIFDYQVCSDGETTYLSVLYGKKNLVLWNTGTGETVYDSRTAGLDDLFDEEEASQKTLSQMLMQDRLYFAVGHCLTGVDVRTGKTLWQVQEDPDIKLTVLDVKDDQILLYARGVRDARRPREETGSAVPGTTFVEDVDELQLRSAVDGSLLCRRKTNIQPDEQHLINVQSAAFSGIGNTILILEGVDDIEAGANAVGKEGESKLQNRLYLLDPETAEEKLLAHENRICDYRMTADGQLLTVSGDLYYGPTELREQNDDGPEIWYAQAEPGRFTIRSTDPETGEVQWETKSSSAQDYHVGLDCDLQVDGKKACLLNAGTHMDILLQESGEKIYAFDFPGLPVAWGMGEAFGSQALTAVLTDGTQASYSFPYNEILREENVFPASITRLEEVEGERYLLCAQEGRLASSNRICVFSEDVYDRDAACVRSISGGRIKMNPNNLQNGNEYYNYKILGNYALNCIALEDLFVLLACEEEGNLRVFGVDAETGRTRWETTLGENVEYLGCSRESGTMVFVDHKLSGLELAMRPADQDPETPEEEWIFLQTRDGHTDTVKGIVENAFETEQVLTRTMTVSKDALIMSVIVDEDEIWMLRYPLSGGETQTVRIPEDKYEEVRHIPYPNHIAVSPDGTLAVCGFAVSDYTEDGSTETDWINLLVNWKTGTITELENTPPVQSTSAITWKPDGKAIAFLGTDGYTELVSVDGTVLYESRPGKEGSTCEIGFCQGDLFTVDEVGFDIYFRIPEKKVDILLPISRMTQYDRDGVYAQISPSWELPEGKILLRYGAQSFILDPGTGIVEGNIDLLYTYNPQTDTLLLLDEEDDLALSPRYDWEELAEKGREELEKVRILEP